MAEESQDGQEKTEEPTSRKLEKAAEEGQVLSSKEMFVFTGILVMFGLVYIIPYYAQMLLSYWSMFFDWSDIVNDKKSILDIFIMRFFIIVIVFISIPMFLIVLLTQIAVGGINFAPKALQFKGKKINPIEGLKRMFSQKPWQNCKGYSKSFAIIWFNCCCCVRRLDDMIQLTERELSQAVVVMGQAFPSYFLFC